MNRLFKTDFEKGWAAAMESKDPLHSLMRERGELIDQGRRAALEMAKPYLGHRPPCDVLKHHMQGPPFDCTCGLDALLAGVA